MHQCKNCSTSIKAEHIFCCYCGFDSEPQGTVQDLPESLSGVEQSHENPDTGDVASPAFQEDMCETEANTAPLAHFNSNTSRNSETSPDTESIPFPDIFNETAEPLPRPENTSTADSTAAPFPELSAPVSEPLPFPDIPEAQANAPDSIPESDFPAEEDDFPDLEETQKDLEAVVPTMTAAQPEARLDVTHVDGEAVPFPEIENVQENQDQTPPPLVKPSNAAESLDKNETEDTNAETKTQVVEASAGNENAQNATVDLEKLLETKKEPEYCDMCGRIKAEGAKYCTACGCPI